MFETKDRDWEKSIVLLPQSLAAVLFPFSHSCRQSTRLLGTGSRESGDGKWRDPHILSGCYEFPFTCLEPDLEELSVCCGAHFQVGWWYWMGEGGNLLDGWVILPILVFPTSAFCFSESSKVVHSAYCPGLIAG